MNNRQSKKNFKQSFRRRSKTKKYIGGETCSQYKESDVCIKHKPICLWNFKKRACIDNIEHIKSSTSIENQNPLKNDEIVKPIQSSQKHNEPLQPLQPTVTLSNTPDTPILYGKRQPVSTHIVPIPPVKVQTQPLVRSFQPPAKTILPQQPPQTQQLKSVPKLDNLPLVDPMVSLDKNWPIITDVVNVPGDGNCLFHALRAGLRSLGLFQGSATELRSHIVSELKGLLKNGDDLTAFFSTDVYGRQSAENNLTFGEYFELEYGTATKIPLSNQVKVYLDQMAKNRWGTEIEIWMASRIFNVNIDVYTLPRDPHTGQPIENGKITDKGKVQYLPLIRLNNSENLELPTIRLFNASGSTKKGKHYQVIPSSISFDEYLS